MIPWESPTAIASPWSIQLEPVEGCNYACWFCGIHAIRKKEDWHWRNQMDPAMVREAFIELDRWLPRIRVEINNHGEPALHRNLISIIKAVRVNPRAQIQLQTNGSTIEDVSSFVAKVDQWFEAGVNLLCVNAYKRWWKKPLDLPVGVARFKYFLELAKGYAGARKGTEVIDLYHDNPKHLSMYHYYGPKIRRIFVLDDLGDINQSSRTVSGRPVSKDITNEAGNTPEGPLHYLLHREPIKEPLQKKCTRPFREIILGWDGHINLCCYDWRSQIIFGKFPDHSLKELWESRIWCFVRELLYRKERNMSPCNVCDYNGGWRQGLLRNPEIPASNQALYAAIANHMSQYSLTVPLGAPMQYGRTHLR